MSAGFIGIGGTGSQPFSITIEGLDEVQNSINTLADYLTVNASVEMMQDVGEHVVTWMQDNIAKQFTKHPTGALMASIDYAVMSNDAGDVNLFAGPNDPSLEYTVIHEFGGDIYPAVGGYLKFHGDRGWRTIKWNGTPNHVHMPERSYIRPAFTEHEGEIVAIMEEYLYDAIASGAANL